MIRVLLVDNHDSFTWNLYQIFEENNNCSIQVIPYDQITDREIKNFDKIVLSPGPDVPVSYPQMNDILAHYATKKSILGVCLGYQAIVEHWGGKLYNLSTVFHGKREKIQIDTSDYLFKDFPREIDVGLYHSWAADFNFLPRCFSIIAKSNQNIVMGVSHKELDVKGVQFHPESYMTPLGRKMLDHWIEY